MNRLNATKKEITVCFLVKKWSRLCANSRKLGCSFSIICWTNDFSKIIAYCLSEVRAVWISVGEGTAPKRASSSSTKTLFGWSASSLWEEEDETGIWETEKEPLLQGEDERTRYEDLILWSWLQSEVEESLEKHFILFFAASPWKEQNILGPIRAERWTDRKQRYSFFF